MVSGSGESAHPRIDVTQLRGETQRLVLRQYRAADAGGLAAIYATAESVRYEPFPVVEGDVLDRAMARRTAPAFENNDDKLYFVAADRTSGVMVGEFGIFQRSVENGVAVFGYGINPGWIGRGLATEGSWAMMARAFETLGVRRLIADLDPRNAASLVIMDKLGMRREAHFVQSEWVKGELVDEVVYAMLVHEWPGTTGVVRRSLTARMIGGALRDALRRADLGVRRARRDLSQPFRLSDGQPGHRRKPE